MTIKHIFTNAIPDAVGTVTVPDNAGGFSTVEASALVRPSDWNSAHVMAYPLAGNTAGSSAVSGTDVYFYGGNNITLSGTSNSVQIHGANQTAYIFSDSNGVSFGTNGSTVTASHNGLVQSQADALYAPKLYTGEPNGFIDRTKATVTWDDSTRTLTVTPVGSYVVWSEGVKMTISTVKTFTISNTEGSHFVYFDASGNLQEYIGSFNTALIFDWAYVAYIYWDAANALAVPDAQNEQHGADWPPEIHYQNHVTIGTKFQDGCALLVTANGTGATLGDIEFAGTLGHIWDEDIQHSIPVHNSTDNIPVLYRTGASGLWRYSETSPAIVRTTGSGRAAFNEQSLGVWQLTEMTEAWFSVAYVYATPGLTKKWVVVMGQQQYATLELAEQGAQTAPAAGEMPFLEFKLIGSITFSTSNGYANAVKSKIDSTIAAGYYDWRYTAQASPSAPAMEDSFNILAAGTQTAGTAQTIFFSNANGVSFGLDNGTMTASAVGGAGGGIAAAAGTQTATSGTVAFANSNGITFGMSGSSQITASHNGLTTTPTLDAVQAPVADATWLMNTRQVQFQWGVNASAFSTATNRLGLMELDIAGAFTQANVDGLHIHQSTNDPTQPMDLIHLEARGTAVTPLRIIAGGSVGAELNAPLNFTSGSVPMILGTSQSNSVANLNANYLQGKQSSQFAGTGTSFGGTNISGSITLNSAGINLSMSVGAGGAADGYNSAQFTNSTANSTMPIVWAGNSNGSGNITLGLTGSTVTGSAPAGGGGGIAAAAGTQTATSGTVVFANSNGITFGMSGSTQVTASHNGITQQSTQPAVAQLNGSSGTMSIAVGSSLSASSNASTITFGLASNITTALQSAGNYLTTARASNDAIGLNSALTANGVSMTANSSGLSLNFPAFLTTAALSNHSHGFSAQGGSSAFQTLNFSNNNNVSFSNSNGQVVASASFAQTNQTVGLYHAGNTTGQSSSSTVDARSISFSGAGIASVGMSGGSVVISVPAGGGGGDGVNIVSMLTSTSGGGTAGATFSTLSGSIGLMAGSNITLSQTSNTIVINGPTAGGGAAATVGGWEVFPAGNNSVFSTLGLNTVQFQKLRPEQNISFNNFELRASGSTVSSTNSQVVSHTYDYGLFARDTGTNSSRVSLVASSRIVYGASYNSNTAAGYTVSQGAASFTSSSGGTALMSALSGLKHLYLPFTTTLTAGGEYWFGLLMSSATTVGTSPWRLGVLEQTVINNLTVGKIYNSTILATNASYVGDYAQGVLTATSAAFPTTVADSQISNAVSQARLYMQLEV